MKKSKRGTTRFTQSRQHVVEQYPINDLASLQALQKKHKGRDAFQYDFVTNKYKQNNNLIIAPCDLMGGRLGVYATEDMKADKKSIGRYAGKRSKRGGSVDSLYAFQISDAKGGVIEFIDADKHRDWTGFINHSPCSNICIEQRKVNGKYQILFYLERDIKKGEQLLYNYGEFYFAVANIKPFYLHASDNWRTIEEVYLENKAFYAKDRYIFSDTICNDFGLVASKTIDHHIPRILIPVIQANAVALKKLLDQSYSTELLVYSCDKNKFLGYAKQQHLTPLMFACYLGNQKIIEMLIHYGADVSRRTLNSGKSAFDFLMSGLATRDVKESVGKLLLKKMHQLSVLDQDGLSSLHGAVVQNLSSLVKVIIKRFEDERHDWLRMLFTKSKRVLSHASFDYCLTHSQFALLKLLLQSAIRGYGGTKDGIVTYIMRKQCFNPQLLQECTVDQLEMMKKLLNDKPFKLLLMKTDLIDRIDRVLKKKYKIEQR